MSDQPAPPDTITTQIHAERTNAEFFKKQLEERKVAALPNAGAEHTAAPNRSRLAAFFRFSKTPAAVAADGESKAKNKAAEEPAGAASKSMPLIGGAWSI